MLLLWCSHDAELQAILSGNFAWFIIRSMCHSRCEKLKEQTDLAARPVACLSHVRLSARLSCPVSSSQASFAFLHISTDKSRQTNGTRWTWNRDECQHWQRNIFDHSESLVCSVWLFQCPMCHLKTQDKKQSSSPLLSFLIRSKQKKTDWIALEISLCLPHSCFKTNTYVKSWFWLSCAELWHKSHPFLH